MGKRIKEHFIESTFAVGDGLGFPGMIRLGDDANGLRNSWTRVDQRKTDRQFGFGIEDVEAQTEEAVFALRGQDLEPSFDHDARARGVDGELDVEGLGPQIVDFGFFFVGITGINEGG